MNITLLGCGRWGSFIAWYMNRIGNDVCVWGRETSPEVVEFFTTRKNNYVEFPKEIKLTYDLQKAVNFADYIIISIPAQCVRDLLTTLVKQDNVFNKKFILCMKGIEDVSGKRLSEILIEFGISPNNIAVWVGPGHIQEFTNGVPSLMIIDSVNKDLSYFLVQNFRSELIKFYQGQDLIGTEIGAAAKNVMGIAAGMLDGGNMKVLKGPLMARGSREISRLINAAGGNELSAYGLCHLGDYEATLFSEFSHNRRFGEMYVKGEKFDKLAEGVKTSGALLALAKQLNVELPITKAVNDIIVNKKDAKKVLFDLFERTNINEF